MAEGAGGGIFMDVMPRLESSSLGSVINDLTAKMSKLGQDSGGAFGKSFGSGVSSASQNMAGQLEQNMQKAQRSVESAMSGMVRAQNDQVLSAGKVEAAQAKLNETLSKYEAGSSKAITAQNNLIKAQQGAETAARNAQKATNDQIAAGNALSDATVAQKKHVDDSGNSMAAFGKAATVAGAAITVGFVASVGVAIDKAAEFQTTQTRLVTSAGEVAGNLKMVSDGLLQMAGQVGFTAQELSTGMYTIESAGYHGADGLNVMKAAAQGAKMEGADLKTVADAVSTALTDYHMPASQAATVTSQLVTAVGQGKTTMEELSGSLHSITPLAAAAGISLQDVTGSLAEMTSHGMSADQASQNLADTLRHMMTPTSQMRDELAQIGLTGTDVSDALSSKGLAGTLDMLSQKIIAAEGPDGKMLLNAFNTSKDAAKNLQEVVAKMPPDLQKVTQEFQNGAMSSTDYRKAVGGLPGNMKDLSAAFLSAWDKANGFTNAIKNGSPQAQNYTQSIKAITGDATGLNTTLMLTGENAAATTENIKLISGATQDAKGNVKGWDDIQGTFNQRLSEFKASLGASAISIGNDFLPAATHVATALSDVGTWLSKNKGFLDALIISVGVAAGAFVVFETVSAMWSVLNIGILAASAAMGIFSTAEDVATVSSGGLAAALAATGIPEIALGVAALVAAIAGLVVGVKYAYDHWSWFHTAVQDSWNVLKGVGEWIAGAFMSVVHDLEHAWDNVVHAWNNVVHAAEDIADAVAHAWGNVEHAGSNVEHAVGNIEHAFGNVEHAIGNVAHAADNVATFIDKALRVVAAVVTTVLVVPFVIAFELISKAVMAWWHGVVEPTANAVAAIFRGIVGVVVGVAHGIGDAWNWLWANGIRPALDSIETGLHAAGAAMSWLNDTIVQPVVHAISTAWHWVYDSAVQVVTDQINLAIQAWGDTVSWLHDTIIEPVLHAVGDVWNWLWTTVINPVVTSIEVAIHAWGDAMHWVHDSVIKPVGDAIGTVMGGIKDAFKGVVDWIETQWNRITGIVGPPVRFIVDTVYNNAIVPVWNDVAGVFGLGKIQKVDVGKLGGDSGAAVPHAGGGVWQGAGVLPGYAPGKDSHNAILSPGEGVAVPELVQAIGPSNFMALNYAYSGGRTPGSGPGFDSGGIFSDIGSGISDIAGGAVNIGKKAVGGAVDTAKFLAKLATNPEAAVKELFADATGKTGSTPGAPSQWLDTIKSLPGKFVEQVIDKAKSWLGMGGGNGTPFTGSPDLMGWISQAEQITGVGDSWTGGLTTLIGRESSGNPNAVNTTDINAQRGDPSRGLMQTTGSTFERFRDPSLPDNINDPVANIVAGIRYIQATYGGIGNVQQADPNMPPHGYAAGGIAPGGKTTKKKQVVVDRSAIDRALNWVRSVDGQPYNAEGWLDCSGLISGAYDQLLARPLQRMFTTISDFSALGFKKGSGGIFDIGVTPKPGQAGHMAATLDGHNLESGGPHDNIMIDASAAGADNAQFSDHWYLPGALFSPPYKGAGTTPSASAKGRTKLGTDADKYAKAASKAKTEAQKATAAATKHDASVQKYLDDAAKADKLAATSSGAAKQKHIDAANHYRQLAQNAKDAAQKSRDSAAKYSQQAVDDQAKSEQAKSDSASLGDSQDALTPGSSTSTSNSGGPVQPMSFVDFTSRLGGIAGQAILDTTGIKDPLQSGVGKIIQSLAGAKWGQYGQQSTESAETAGTTESAPETTTPETTTPETATSKTPSTPAGVTPSSTPALDPTTPYTPVPADGYSSQTPAPTNQSGTPTQPDATVPPVPPASSAANNSHVMAGLFADVPGSGQAAATPAVPNRVRDKSEYPAPTPPNRARDRSEYPSSIGTPYPESTSAQQQKTLQLLTGGASVYDEGGWLMPDQLALNLSGRPEPVLAPREKDNLDAIAKGGVTNGLRSMVHIENFHQYEGDGRKSGRDIAREMLAHQRGGVR